MATALEPAPPCTWPACLTPAQSARLVADIGEEEHGRPTTPGPDPAETCGCREARPVIPCADGFFRHSHAPHRWAPQPGMDPVQCPGVPTEVGGGEGRANGTGVGVGSALPWADLLGAAPEILEGRTVEEVLGREAAADEDGESLRERYATAVRAALRAYGEGDADPGTGSDYGDQTAAVLAVRDAEMERLRAELAAARSRQPAGGGDR